MARRKSVGPTERELEILEALWALGEASVRDVHAELSREENVSFTSVQTMLSVMFEKGWASRRLENRGYLYKAAVNKEDVQRTLVADLLERAFDGSAKRLMSRALDVKPLAEQELDEIRRLLHDAEGQADA